MREPRCLAIFPSALAVRRRLRFRLLPSLHGGCIGNFDLSVGRRLLRESGEAVQLTPKAFELLRYLMANSAIPAPHARLLQAVWGPEYGGELEYLRSFRCQLRKKIEDDAAKPVYLLTETDVGYRLRGMDEPGESS